MSIGCNYLLNIYFIEVSYLLNENEYKGILLDIGIKIGYYRRKAGMTQAELAEHTGLTLSYIYKYNIDYKVFLVNTSFWGIHF